MSNFNFSTWMLAGLLLLLACGGSSTKRLARGSYDSAITKAVRNLQKDPGDRAELDILRKAYDQNLLEANAVIDRLKAQNNGDALLGIVREYEKLDRVSNLLQSLPDQIGSQFGPPNYAREIQEYTGQASEALFREGEALMGSPVKEDQRLACEKFRNVRSINPQFPEINRWIQEAEDLAISKILITIQDESGQRFKDSLTTYLNDDGLNELNREAWLRYALFDNQRFDGEVKITIHKIGVEKQATKSETHNYNKEIQSGESKRSVSAKVIEERVDYDVILRGTIAYVDHYTNTPIKSEELVNKKTITRKSYQVNGEMDAVEASMQQSIEESRKMDTPSDKVLIRDQMPAWKDYVLEKIKASRQMF